MKKRQNEKSPHEKAPKRKSAKRKSAKTKKRQTLFEPHSWPDLATIGGSTTRRPRRTSQGANAVSARAARPHQREGVKPPPGANAGSGSRPGCIAFVRAPPPRPTHPGPPTDPADAVPHREQRRARALGHCRRPRGRETRRCGTARPRCGGAAGQRALGPPGQSFLARSTRTAATQGARASCSISRQALFGCVRAVGSDPAARPVGGRPGGRRASRPHAVRESFAAYCGLLLRLIAAYWGLRLLIGRHFFSLFGAFGGC